MTPKGAFAVARVRNLGRQRVFDAIKEVREKGEAWVTMRAQGWNYASKWTPGLLYRCRIVKDECCLEHYGQEALVSANGQVNMSDVIEKDGLWVYDYRGNRRGVGGNVHIEAYIAEKHLAAD
jgi:hypothetical protein